MFYLFKQNNPNKKYYYNKENGIDKYIIIESPNVGEAHEKFQHIPGVYLNGIETGRDDPKSGKDRWYSICDIIEDVPQQNTTNNNCNAFVHLSNGTIYPALINID